MKYECYAKSKQDFEKTREEIRSFTKGWNFEELARLLYTEDNIAVMVEYQVGTKELREILEDEDAPDYLTAYLVKDEEDYSADDEILTDVIDSNIGYGVLQNVMLDFAKRSIECLKNEEEESNETSYK